MMSETLTLMGATKACQASGLGDSRAVSSERLAAFLNEQGGRNEMELYWEQLASKWCLKGGLSGKRQRLADIEAGVLLAPGSKQ